jgi:hypothetical protein
MKKKVLKKAQLGTEVKKLSPAPSDTTGIANDPKTKVLMKKFLEDIKVKPVKPVALESEFEKMNKNSKIKKKTGGAIKTKNKK